MTYRRKTTRDNVSVKVNAVVYFHVTDPMQAVLQVENYLYATSQVSQTTLRSILGQAELDELLAERDKINRRLQEMIGRGDDRGAPDGHADAFSADAVRRRRGK
jgi:regulator of protease activity HflC (stomatin/prohibitin superfamily)